MALPFTLPLRALNWDLRVGPDGKEFADLAAIGLTLYAEWLFAKWFIDRRRDKPHWAAFRYWWPSLMCVPIAGAVFVLCTDLEQTAEWAVAVPFAEGVLLLNLPLAPVIVLEAVLVQMPNVAAYLAISLTAVLAWLSWYGIIRFLEWRSECGAPLSITAEPTSSRPPQS